MSFVSFLNSFCKRAGMILILGVPVIIIILLAIIKFIPSFNPDESQYTITLIITVIWLILVADAALYSLNAVLLAKNFNDSISKKTSEGMPIDSMEGFTEIKKSFQAISKSAFVIASFAIFSFITYIIGAIPGLIEVDARSYFAVLALGMVFITIGIALIIRIPAEPAFKPGGLIGFYIPSKIPTQLDNILSDTFFAYLDPATRIRYDEWTEMIGEMLNDTYEMDETFITRVERAREKILLLYYLEDRMPTLFNEEIIKSELLELIDEKYYDELINGGKSGISLKVVKKLMRELEKYTPELFILIDNLIITLSDNLNEFLSQDLFVKITMPTKHIGLKPFQVMVFILNNSKDYRTKRRPIEISFSADREKLFPYRLSAPLSLDESEDFEIEGKTKIPFYSNEEKDIIALLSELLQIGDAYWIYIKPKGYGETIVNVTIRENGVNVAGVSQTISINRDIMFYIKNYGSKLSFLSGAAAPIINYFKSKIQF